MAARDAAWLEDLVRSHHARVERFVRARLPFADVEDTVAEVFATAWRDRDRVPQAPLPWLLACARHRVMRVGSARARERELVARAQWQAQLAAQAPPQLGWLWEVLDALSPAERELLWLDAFEELSSTELGMVLGCSAATARVRLFRARRHAVRLINASPDHASLPIPVEVQPWNCVT